MSHDVFLSWASPDRRQATRMKSALERRGLRVFWSRRIPSGEDWIQVIKRRLDVTPCLVVLWTHNSVRSTWVRSEAGEAAERGILIPVLIEDVRLPRLFRSFQTHNLVGWRGGVRNHEFNRVVERIREKVDVATEFHDWFQEGVDPEDEVTEEDLCLVDSTWLAGPITEETYHVHVIVHGHKQTLDRISEVVYYLEGWQNGEYRTSTNTSRNFELHEHAWSHFVVKATVKFPNQSSVILRRFIQLTPDGPSLEPFMQTALTE